jgi:hypothetical protein
MMPSLVTALEEMPLLFMGDAVDRGALPLPDWAAADALHVEPANGLERQLQAIWQEVLRCERVSTQADFFSLGGNDVKVGACRLASTRTGCPGAWALSGCAPAQAAEVMKRVREASGRAVPTVTLFRAPTIVGLAGALAGMPRASLGAIPRAPFSAAEKAAGVPCPTSMEGYGQRALDAPEQADARNIPVTLRLGGALDLGALRAALAHLVARHEPLRTRLVLRHGQVLQAVAPAGDPRTAPQLIVEPAPAGGAMALTARLEAAASQPFQLYSDASLMRALLVVIGPEESTLLVCVHHAGAPPSPRSNKPDPAPAYASGMRQPA